MSKSDHVDATAAWRLPDRRRLHPTVDAPAFNLHINLDLNHHPFHSRSRVNEQMYIHTEAGVRYALMCNILWLTKNRASEIGPIYTNHAYLQWQEFADDQVISNEWHADRD